MACFCAGAQWQLQTVGTDADFRGLSVPDAQTVWASGTKGTFVRTVDGGATWHVGQVPGAEKLDFRDVEARDARTAWLLSAGNGRESRIYKTTDGGKAWTLQFQNEKPGAFFDSLAFWNDQRGIALSDPIDGRFLLVVTTNGGASWATLKSSMPPALPNESAFAASGTCLVVGEDGHVWFGTGGASRSRVFRSTDGAETWSVFDTPVRAGKASAGIFSLAFRDGLHGVAIGGDFTKPEQSGGNMAFTQDGGQTWKEGPLPLGFRSAVAWMREPGDWSLLAVGTSGSDRAIAGGAWRALDVEKYNALSVAQFDPKAAWAAGPKGRVAHLIIPRSQ